MIVVELLLQVQGKEVGEGQRNTSLPLSSKCVCEDKRLLKESSALWQMLNARYRMG